MNSLRFDLVKKEIEIGRLQDGLTKVYSCIRRCARLVCHIRRPVLLLYIAKNNFIIAFKTTSDAW